MERVNYGMKIKLRARFFEIEPIRDKLESLSKRGNLSAKEQTFVDQMYKMAHGNFCVSITQMAWLDQILINNGYEPIHGEGC